MKKRDLEKTGIPRGDAMDVALQAAIAALRGGMGKREVLTYLRTVVESPGNFRNDPLFGALACQLEGMSEPADRGEKMRRAPYRIWGKNIDEAAITQLEHACALPVAVRGALMPDAHVGYGLPIGGVLAVRGAVIPYAVGVDIACRMKMSVLDLPVNLLKDDPSRFKEAIAGETLFGVGAAFRQKNEHPVMDRDWRVSPITALDKNLAWSQLGTSGSGNHFVEFGTLTVERVNPLLRPGVYLALLSHSGSRGIGSKVASHYSGIAMQKHRELPRESRHLAWLRLDTMEGSEYWAAMELMGAYAAANHEIIHRRIAGRLGATVALNIENHHNFAWKERHDGEEVIVHRKGATPAGAGDVGIIPGSMGTPGFVVVGKGCPDSLHSAAHGAGRSMSRGAAKQQYRWSDALPLLDAAGVTVMSAGLDEVPMAYK
ncbi:MAG: RtcB family protein, partial [Chitinispirillaceae bacterium]|nr:RtcB family protein [Chitinispirillaceae bacterium]